ncbi:MAG: phage major capsid protein [Candidatus Kapaibacterium sp.]
MHRKITKQEFESFKQRNLGTREAVLLNSSFKFDEATRESTIETVIATETPAIVIDWERSNWDRMYLMREILVINTESVVIPSIGQVPFLDSHRTWEGSDSVKGSIRNIRIENGQVVGTTVISSTEEKLAKKIEERHLTNVSAGYGCSGEFSFRLNKDETANVSGRIFKNEFTDGLPLMIRTKWELAEGSSVIWGADENAQHRSEPTFEELQQKLADQQTEINELKTRTQIKSKENSTMADLKTPEEILKDEAARRKEIRETAKRFVGRISDIETLQNDAEDKGWTVEQFNGEIVSRMSNGEQFSTPPTDLDLSAKDKKRYNIWNLVRSVHEKNPDLAGLEREASAAIAKRLGVTPNGFYVDYGYQKREITIGVGSADQLVATELQASSFLDLLYNKMVFGKFLNVKNISGLVGNLQFPNKTAGSTGYYIGESAAGTESNITFGSQTMSPKTVSALVQYSRQTALQTTPAMEGLVIADVVNALRLRADLSMIQGQGTSDELLGLLYGDGVQTYDGSEFSFDSAVDMETLLDDVNVDMDAAKWLTTPLVKGALRKRKIEAGQTDKLWKNNQLIERDAYATKQMPTNVICLVDPSEIIVGTWGVLDIQINRLNDDGGVKIIPFWSHDMINRRAAGTVKTSPVFS